jgi:hypothetical protein
VYDDPAIDDISADELFGEYPAVPCRRRVRSTSSDPELYRAIRRVWALGHRTLQHRFPPGVYKWRSIEEMNALEAEWEDANFGAYQRRLRPEKE